MVPPPSVDLMGPPQNITLCADLEIKIVNQYQNAKRDVEIISWELSNINDISDS